MVWIEMRMSEHRLLKKGKLTKNKGEEMKGEHTDHKMIIMHIFNAT